MVTAIMRRIIITKSKCRKILRKISQPSPGSLEFLDFIIKIVNHEFLEFQLQWKSAVARWKEARFLMEDWSVWQFPLQWADAVEMVELVRSNAIFLVLRVWNDLSPNEKSKFSSSSIFAHSFRKNLGSIYVENISHEFEITQKVP